MAGGAWGLASLDISDGGASSREASGTRVVATIATAATTTTTLPPEPAPPPEPPAPEPPPEPEPAPPPPAAEPRFVAASDAEANIALGQQLAAQIGGWTGPEWDCLYDLWAAESGWRTEAHNPSGAHGIPQALPGSKMGPGWENDPHVQIEWGLGYIGGRYGSPCNAWGHFLAYRWY